MLKNPKTFSISNVFGKFILQGSGAFGLCLALSQTNPFFLTLKCGLVENGIAFLFSVTSKEESTFREVIIGIVSRIDLFNFITQKEREEGLQSSSSTSGFTGVNE